MDIIDDASLEPGFSARGGEIMEEWKGGNMVHTVEGTADWTSIAETVSFVLKLPSEIEGKRDQISLFRKKTAAAATRNEEKYDSKEPIPVLSETEKSTLFHKMMYQDDPQDCTNGYIERNYKLRREANNAHSKVLSQVNNENSSSPAFETSAVSSFTDTPSYSSFGNFAVTSSSFAPCRKSYKASPCIVKLGASSKITPEVCEGFQEPKTVQISEVQMTSRVPKSSRNALFNSLKNKPLKKPADFLPQSKMTSEVKFLPIEFYNNSFKLNPNDFPPLG